MNVSAPYKGAWAKIMAACVLDGAYMMPSEFLPNADCEKCEHRQRPERRQDGHCYMFMEKPGDKCGQFRNENA